MKVSDKLLDMIKREETLALTSYNKDGHWTIGYGHTYGVKKGQTITKEQAESLLKGDYLDAEKQVASLRLNLTQGQFDALADFCFNIGVGKLKGSTLYKKIISKAPTKEIQVEFKRWVYGNRPDGSYGVLGGLVRRREWDAQRWAEAD